MYIVANNRWQNQQNTSAYLFCGSRAIVVDVFYSFDMIVYHCHLFSQCSENYIASLRCRCARVFDLFRFVFYDQVKMQTYLRLVSHCCFWYNAMGAGTIEWFHQKKKRRKYFANGQNDIDLYRIYTSNQYKLICYLMDALHRFNSLVLFLVFLFFSLLFASVHSLIHKKYWLIESSLKAENEWNVPVV